MKATDCITKGDYAIKGGLQPNEITFNNPQEIIRLNANGDIYVKGKLIENDKELVDAMREFLSTGEKTYKAE